MLDTPSPRGEGGGPVPAAPAPCLTLENISKRFPGVVALNDVSLSLYPGEVHAICGENGAGKSTLMKIVSGQQPPDEGRILSLIHI